MVTKSETGKLGEDLASRYLESRGYKVIDRNWRKQFGELDIICLDKNKTLVFIEVKTVNDNTMISAESQVTNSKLTKLRKTSLFYANNLMVKNSKIIGWQIDLLAITISNGRAKIKHYKNIG